MKNVKRENGGLKGKTDVLADALVAAKTERRKERFIRVQLLVTKIF